MIRPFLRSPSRRFAQARTTVTLEKISTNVLIVAAGTLTMFQGLRRPMRIARPQQDLRGEERAEEHDLGPPKRARRRAGVVEARVGTGVDVERNLQLCVACPSIVYASLCPPRSAAACRRVGGAMLPSERVAEMKSVRSPVAVLVGPRVTTASLRSFRARAGARSWPPIERRSLPGFFPRSSSPYRSRTFVRKLKDEGDLEDEQADGACGHERFVCSQPPWHAHIARRRHRVGARRRPAPGWNSGKKMPLMKTIEPRVHAAPEVVQLSPR